MRNIIKGIALLTLAIAFAACQQATDPVSPVSVEKNNVQMTDRAVSGTFEITFPDSRASELKGPVTGTIDFEFDDATSSYKYRGSVVTTTNGIYSGTFENTGTFERKGDFITLIDNPKAESGVKLGSLFLNGDFQYTVRGTQTIIEGNTRIGHLKIVLY